MSVLVPCPACARHIRGAETSCPFCHAPTEGLLAHAPREAPRVGRHLSRAALALASMAAVSACEKGPSNPAYGGPPPMMEDAAPVTPTALRTETPPAPAYGGPPLVVATDAEVPQTRAADAGAPPKPVPNMQNVPAPAYGGPPPKKH
ncbi:hypothetical protein BH11MYX4_BH11MYX4_70000 [soil metagenome]